MIWDPFFAPLGVVMICGPSFATLLTLNIGPLLDTVSLRRRAAKSSAPLEGTRSDGQSTGICADGVDREISASSSVISSGTPSKSGVER